ncbi:MAG: abortive infection family protein [Prevotellaceae bacterium]|nr:abortive infection family protein [Prevotellaceae bacterium]
MSKISDVTRRHIADEMSIHKIWYCGNLTELDFLSRLYNLKSFKSMDYRYNNAYDDIYQHTVNNNDWSDDWIYSDPRINLSYCDDETYLKFLENTVHPRVRSNSDEVVQLIKIYNKNLANDGFEIVQTNQISSYPVYEGRAKSIEANQLAAKKVEIKKFLDTEYVNNKIKLMQDAVNKDTDLAIGTAKEFLETTCQSILKQKGVVIDKNWSLSRIVKETSNILDFTPKNIDDAEKAKKSIIQILSGISSIVQGVAELRNSYGTGHGKDADFKGLEPKYANLLVSVVSDIVLLYLSTNGETAELVEL